MTSIDEARAIVVLSNAGSLASGRGECGPEIALAIRYWNGDVPDSEVIKDATELVEVIAKMFNGRN